MSFIERHGLRFAYVSGAMANGIASVELVELIAATGCLGFFVLLVSVLRPEKAIHRRARARSFRWSSALCATIHSPNEPGADCSGGSYTRYAVRKVSAAAYMKLTQVLFAMHLADRLTSMGCAAQNYPLPRSHVQRLHVTLCGLHRVKWLISCLRRG